MSLPVDLSPKGETNTSRYKIRVLANFGYLTWHMVGSESGFKRRPPGPYLLYL